MHRQHFSTAALLPVLLLALPAVGEAQTLRYKFDEGASHKYRMVLDQTMDMNSSVAPGVTQTMKTHMDVDFTHKVLKPTPDGARMEIGFDRMDAKAEFAGNEMPVPGMDEISKAKLELDMSTRGEMKNIELKNTEGLGPQAQQIAREMKKSIAQNALVFPDKPLAPGQTWTTEQEVPTNMGSGKDLLMKVKSTYKFTGMAKHLGRQAARIETKVVISLHGKTTQMDVPIQADMDGSGKGTAWFLPDVGQMLHTQADFKIDGQVIGTQQGRQLTTKMKIGMKVDMKLK